MEDEVYSNTNQLDEFKEAIEPVHEFLEKYGDLHTSVIVELGFARIVQDLTGVPLKVPD